MRAWTNRPDRDPTTLHLDILRARPGKAYSGVSMATDVVGAYTHYWRGRTVLCTTPNCDACHAQRKARWYGYIPLWEPDTDRRVLLEITAACLDAIDAYIASNDTLRGARVTVRRANNKINSKIIATLTHAGLTDGRIPTEPPTRQLLERMWEIETNTHPATPETETAQKNEPRVGEHANGRPATKRI